MNTIPETTLAQLGGASRRPTSISTPLVSPGAHAGPSTPRRPTMSTGHPAPPPGPRTTIPRRGSPVAWPISTVPCPWMAKRSSTRMVITTAPLAVRPSPRT